MMPAFVLTLSHATFPRFGHLVVRGWQLAKAVEAQASNQEFRYTNGAVNIIPINNKLIIPN